MSNDAHVEIVEAKTMLEGVLQLVVLFATWLESEEPGTEDATATQLHREVGAAFAAKDAQPFGVAARRYGLYCEARMGGAKPAEALAKADASMRSLELTCEAIEDGTRLRITTRERS